ncbi:MAG: hypothetical protein LBT29_08115, partial [Flavobacteriaceae bacterium]|nr:hypothetical protein [Flavobacteriaceae bacterium]
KKIQIESTTKIPMLFFVSNGKGTGLSREKWENIFKQYSDILDVQLIFLDASHYLHNIESERIALESKMFIENVLKND